MLLQKKLGFSRVPEWFVYFFFKYKWQLIAAAVFPHPAEFDQLKNCIPKATSVWPLGASYTDIFLSFPPISTFYLEIKGDTVKR